MTRGTNILPTKLTLFILAANAIIPLKVNSEPIFVWPLLCRFGPHCDPPKAPRDPPSTTTHPPAQQTPTEPPRPPTPPPIPALDASSLDYQGSRLSRDQLILGILKIENFIENQAKLHIKIRRALHAAEEDLDLVRPLKITTNDDAGLLKTLNHLLDVLPAIGDATKKLIQEILRAKNHKPQNEQMQSNSNTNEKFEAAAENGYLSEYGDLELGLENAEASNSSYPGSPGYRPPQPATSGASQGGSREEENGDISYPTEKPPMGLLTVAPSVNNKGGVRTKRQIKDLFI